VVQVTERVHVLADAGELGDRLRKLGRLLGERRRRREQQQREHEDGSRAEESTVWTHA
jgi:hypothetical protein